MLRFYWVATNTRRENIQVSGAIQNPIRLSGGNSDVTFHVNVDFTALGIDQLRQAWLTFAPKLTDSAAYSDTQADAVFTNWTISADPNRVSPLHVAGPGSVRVEESDARVVFQGSGWSLTDAGWFSKGFAQVSRQVGDMITVQYSCSQEHDLWLGTSLHSDRGIFGISVDGAAQPDLNTMLVSFPTGVATVPVSIPEAISTRRKIASRIAAGNHTVVLTVKVGDAPPAGIVEYGYCYFDFLEAVIPSDVPVAPGPRGIYAPAIDYDTNHGYQLAPARLMWMYEKLGFAGNSINQYVGTFWWNQRRVYGQTLASASVDLSSCAPAAGDGIFVVIGGTTIGTAIRISSTTFAHGDRSTEYARGRTPHARRHAPFALTP